VLIVAVDNRGFSNSF